MSATTYTMRALANPGPGYVTWQTVAAGDREYIIQSKYDGVADEPKLTGARFILR